ncbi:MAG: FkbM family methyltransferase [Usitatibacteraceae bacterium]
MATDLQTYVERIGDGYQLTMADIANPLNRGLVEAYCKSKCRFVNVPDDASIAMVLGKYKMWVDLRDERLCPHLVFDGFWEMWVTSALARLTPVGTLAIDIGAHVGYYTMLMADAVGPEGNVLAFEPNPRLANFLRASASANGFGGRIAVREEAVSDRTEGDLEFAVPRISPQNAAVIYDRGQAQGFRNVFGEGVEFLHVKPITLDSLDLAKVGMVKIDAEGAELSIWRGMQKTIEHNPDIRICLEFQTDRSYDWQSFFRDMEARFGWVRHIDFDGLIKPLDVATIERERPNGDWMLYLARD